MSPLPKDWALPFLEQAREDLKAAWLLLDGKSRSTLCMLILGHNWNILGRMASQIMCTIRQETYIWHSGYRTLKT